MIKTMEKPILFNDRMVCAILSGQKTVTRRVVKTETKCPYGNVGDRLWVRETWRPYSWGSDFDWMMIQYRAGGQNKHVDPCEMWKNPIDRWEKITQECEKLGNPHSDSGDFTIVNPLKWRPSIFMPRAASRITLEITSVNLERLQGISEASAIAEGVERVGDLWKCYGKCPDHATGHDKRTSATASFMSLWDSINADRDFGWDSNPTVWAIGFSKVVTNG